MDAVHAVNGLSARGIEPRPGMRPGAAGREDGPSESGKPARSFQQVLASLPDGGERPPDHLRGAERLAWAAREMEAFFLQEMWKAMRRSLPEAGLFPRSPGSRVFDEMLDVERSRQMASSGQLGLAALVYERMLPHVAPEGRSE